MRSLIEGACAPKTKYLFNWKYNPAGIRPQDWLTSQGFYNIQDDYYWSLLSSGSNKVAVYEEFGYINEYNFDEDSKSYVFNESNKLYIWPIRNAREPSIVSGYVYDSVTHETISSAVVAFENQSIVTDKYGNFSSNVPTVCLTATAKKPGYSEQKSSIITFQSGERVVDFYLIKEEIKINNKTSTVVTNTHKISNINPYDNIWVCDSSNKICGKNIKHVKQDDKLTLFDIEMYNTDKAPHRLSITIGPCWGYVFSNFTFTTNIEALINPSTTPIVIRIKHDGLYESPTKMWKIESIKLID